MDAILLGSPGIGYRLRTSSEKCFHRLICYLPCTNLRTRPAVAIPGSRTRDNMVDFNLIADLGIQQDDADAMIRAQLNAEVADGDMSSVLSGEMQQYSRGKILQGKVVGKAGDDAIVDVGLKSEGLVNKNEFDNWDTLAAGDEVEVLLEDLEDSSGIIKLSKRKADRIRGWERILETKTEGDIIEGRCMRKIKGGLLVLSLIHI